MNNPSTNPDPNVRLDTGGWISGPALPGVAPPEAVLINTADAAAADLRDLTRALPGDPAANARIADRLAEEVAEVGLRLRCLPGVPVPMSGRDCQLLTALRTAVAEGEDVGEFVARGLARLAWELGGSYAVTANRPGSWESAIIADLLERTTGPGPDDAYRTTQ